MFPRHIAALFFFAAFISACTEHAHEDTAPRSSSSALSETEQDLSYTLLSEDERAQATRQPWETPGHENLKPPASILQGRYGDREHYVPNPRGIELLDELERESEKERSRLIEEEQLAPADIRIRLNAFHDAFLRQQSQRDTE